VIWICRNGPDEDNGRLEKLAAAGNGEALYALAQRVNKTDRLKARRLMRRALMRATRRLLNSICGFLIAR